LTSTSKTGYSENYKYNFLGQKIEDKKNYVDESYTLKYDYDLQGNITQITYPDNKVTNYNFVN
jgi:YD repeat-containing protein